MLANVDVELVNFATDRGRNGDEILFNAEEGGWCVVFETVNFTGESHGGEKQSDCKDDGEIDSVEKCGFDFLHI